MLREMNIKISRVFRIGQAYMNGKAKEYGLSSGLFFYLLELSGQDGMTMQELSRAVGVDNGLTTRSVKKLEDLGYVRKERNPLDARSAVVNLTDRGREAAQAIGEILLTWKGIVTEGVAEEDLLLVNRVFDRFYANASEAVSADSETLMRQHHNRYGSR